MSDDLKADLMEIQGVGDATAESILELIPDDVGEPDPYIDKAIEAAEAGNNRQAVVYLRRAGGD